MESKYINESEKPSDSSKDSSMKGATHKPVQPHHDDKSLLENLPGIFFLYSFPELRMENWNKNHETLFGFSSPEMKGRHILDWFHQKNHSEVLRAIKMLNREGRCDFESELVKKDKEPVPFLLSMGRIERDQKVSIIGTGIDISERAEAEEALKRSKSDLSSILSEMNGAVWSIAWPERKFVYLSPSAEILYGRPLRELMSHEDQSYEFTHPDDKAVIEQVTIELDRDGVSEQEFRVIRPDGRVVWVNSRCKMVYDERGKPVRVDGFDTDITKRKELEEAFETSKKTMDEDKDQWMNTVREIESSLSKILDEDTPYERKQMFQVVNHLLTILKPLSNWDDQ